MREQSSPRFPLVNGFFRPFLYGPFWIFTSCILVFGILSYFLIGRRGFGPGLGFGWIAWIPLLVYYAMEIFQETAAGYDKIHVEWDDFDYHEALHHALWGLYHFAIASVPGLILATFFYEAFPRDVPFRAVLFPVVSILLIAPHCLLAGLVNDSLWNPFSTPVLRSVFAKPVSWLCFYLLSAIAILSFLFLSLQIYKFVLATQQNRFLKRLVFGSMITPPAIFVTFCYTRLLGRLAWIIENAQK